MLETLIQGGWVMVPLLICSGVAVTVIIERGMFIRQAGKKEQADALLALAGEGKVSQALELARDASLPLVKVLKAGLDCRHNPAKAMEAAALGEVTFMKRGLPVLETIITLSPLLGLLGTIIGMIDSFEIMALSGSSQPHAVTGGVAEALIATAGGITVAVLTLIPYNYFLAWVERETETMEQYATRLELMMMQPQEGR